MAGLGVSGLTGSDSRQYAYWPDFVGPRWPAEGRCGLRLTGEEKRRNVRRNGRKMRTGEEERTVF